MKTRESKNLSVNTTRKTPARSAASAPASTWDRIKKWLVEGCVYYTIVSIVLILLSLLSVSTENRWAIPTNFWQVLPASLAFAFAGEILSSKSLARWKRYLLHYIIYLSAILLFFFLPSDAKPQPISVLLMLVLLTLLYWVIFGLVLFIRSRIQRLLEEDD